MPIDISQSIIGISDECLGLYYDNCSAFAAEVARRCGVILFGNANDIIDHITRAWRQLNSGLEAAQAAKGGLFVIGGLKATPNGHVVVVVDGPVSHGKYPYAYWGQYHRLSSFGHVYNVGFTRGHGATNWAWGLRERDQVQFAATVPSSLLISANRPKNYADRGRIKF